MDDIALRFWAMRYNDRLGGILSRYLNGHEPLDMALVSAVEGLHQLKDLSRIQDLVDDLVRDVTEHPKAPVPLQTLEAIQKLVDERVEKLAVVEATSEDQAEKALGSTGGGGILSDRQIRRLVQVKGMIEPFSDRQIVKIQERTSISHGLSSYGYDARVANEFKIFTNVHTAEIDPKNFDPKSFVDMQANSEGFIRIPPNSFALGRTVERFSIPRDVLVVCLGKSTYARCGIIVNVTPLEPEWEGYVTLEFSNTTPLPARIYAGEGACQFLFFGGTEPCEVSYADRKGKYQDQEGVTIPRMK